MPVFSNNSLYSLVEDNVSGVISPDFARSRSFFFTSSEVEDQTDSKVVASEV